MLNANFYFVSVIFELLVLSNRSNPNCSFSGSFLDGTLHQKYRKIKIMSVEANIFHSHNWDLPEHSLTAVQSARKIGTRNYSTKCFAFSLSHVDRINRLNSNEGERSVTEARSIVRNSRIVAIFAKFLAFSYFSLLRKRCICMIYAMKFNSECVTRATSVEHSI